MKNSENDPKISDYEWFIYRYSQGIILYKKNKSTNRIFGKCIGMDESMRKWTELFKFNTDTFTTKITCAQAFAEML